MICIITYSYNPLSFLLTEDSLYYFYEIYYDFFPFVVLGRKKGRKKRLNIPLHFFNLFFLIFLLTMFAIAALPSRT